MYKNANFNKSYVTPLNFGSYGGSMPPTMDPMKAMDQAINWGWQFVELGLGPTGGGGQTFSAGKAGEPSREELARLAKLNKMSMSIHHSTGDDPSGFAGQQGFNEMARQRAEYNMQATVDFVDDVATKMGAKNVPIVIHSSAGVPGNVKKDEEMYFADLDTGSIGMVKRERRLKDGKPDWAEPQELLDEYNRKLKMNEASRMTSLDYNKYFMEGQMDRIRTKILNEKDPKEVLKLKEDYETTKETIQQLEEDYKLHRDEWKRKTLQYEKDGEYKQFVPIEQFAEGNAAKTIANLAHYAWKKKSKPTVCVENLFPEWYGGKPEEMKELLKKSREEFVNNRPKGMSKGEAEKASKQIIGMTIDVGHMNMWRRYKDSKDFKKDIQNKFAELAPYTKHVHLSDNFGDMDAHLPIGWGNAPNKEIMENLKKEGYKGKVLLESYGLPEGAHFGVYQSLPNMSAPLYTVGPTWSEAAGSYFFGDYPFSMGPIFPGIHHEQYGAGFSGLPSVMGAQRPGQKSRFGGTPMS